MGFWDWLFTLRAPKKRLPSHRDPDLDLVKQMTEQHEYRIQILEEEADRIAGGVKPLYRGPDRRQFPRH